MTPTVKLANNVVVANFSSPHQFIFSSGEILPACSPERAKSLMLNSREEEIPREKWTDISLIFEMSESVRAEILALQSRDDIDIVLVPLPVMQAWKESGEEVGKLRVCRVADRVAKTIYSDRFCV